MKEAFVCPAACELFSLFIRLFYQDGKTAGVSAWKSAWWGVEVEFLGGGLSGEKKSHWCQLAALSYSCVKLKTKDSSLLQVEKKKVENYQNQWKLLQMIMDLNLQFAPVSFH